MPRAKAPLRQEFILCPRCQGQHIDRGEWAEKNHSRHLCEHCHRFFFTKPGNIGVELPHAKGCLCLGTWCIQNLPECPGPDTDAHASECFKPSPACLVRGNKDGALCLVEGLTACVPADDSWTRANAGLTVAANAPVAKSNFASSEEAKHEPALPSRLPHLRSLPMGVGVPWLREALAMSSSDATAKTERSMRGLASALWGIDGQDQPFSPARCKRGGIHVPLSDAAICDSLPLFQSCAGEQAQSKLASPKGGA